MKLSALQCLGLGWLFIIAAIIFCSLGAHFQSVAFLLLSIFLALTGIGFSLSSLAKKLQENKSTGKTGDEK